MLDGLDGRIARLLSGQSRFGAELEFARPTSSPSASRRRSSSICGCFSRWPSSAGFERWTRYGWLFALAYAVCMALRLARFNAHIDVEDQPHKSAGFLTGVPAPAGAGLVLLPDLSLASGPASRIFRETWLVAPWAAVVAFLMISNLATFSWGSLRLRSHVRLGAIVVIALVVRGARSRRPGRR